MKERCSPIKWQLCKAPPGSATTLPSLAFLTSPFVEGSSSTVPSFNQWFSELAAQLNPLQSALNHSSLGPTHPQSSSWHTWDKAKHLHFWHVPGCGLCSCPTITLPSPYLSTASMPETSSLSLGMPSPQCDVKSSMATRGQSKSSPFPLPQASSALFPKEGSKEGSEHPLKWGGGRRVW